jgi:hypothetical protein
MYAPGADPHLEVERHTAAEDVVAEPALARTRSRWPPATWRWRRGTPSGCRRSPRLAPTARAGDDHALDEGERVALHEHPVGEGPAVALVGVAADELLVGLRASSHGAPLDAGREPGTTAAAQARGDELVDHLDRSRGDHAPQAREAAVLEPVGEVERIDHADALEGDAGLRRQPRHLLHRAER